MNLKVYIKNRPRIKRYVYRLIMHPTKTRPNWWMRPLLFLFMKQAKNSVIYRSVRKDITPFHSFSLGNYSIIEDYSCINNAVGDILIKNYTRIGLHNTIIGPVYIGSHVNLAQGVVVSALNHNYKDVDCNIDKQGISISPINIHDDVWIGANSVISAGVTIGKHCVIGAGSIVTKNIPEYSVAVGNPAKVIKRYDTLSKEWRKTNKI